MSSSFEPNLISVSSQDLPLSASTQKSGQITTTRKEQTQSAIESTIHPARDMHSNTSNSSLSLMDKQENASGETVEPRNLAAKHPTNKNQPARKKQYWWMQYTAPLNDK